MIVIYNPEAQKQLDKMDRGIKAALAAKIAELANWPDVSGCFPLRGELAGQYKARVRRDYRIRFEVTGEDEITILQVGHRDGFYED